jgi:hypothetical protein
MGGFFQFAAITLASFGSLVALLGSLRRIESRWLSVVIFLVASASAYAVSFSLDMAVTAEEGSMDLGRAVLPICVWSGYGLGLYMLARQFSPSGRLVAIPFALLGGFVTLLAVFRFRNLLIGVPLLLVACLSVWLLSPAPLIAQANGEYLKPMGWSLQEKAAERRFSVGKYHLDMSVDSLPGLTEFTEKEYEVMGRTFQGEANYNAPPVEFLGRPWKLMLGTVNRHVYKIAPYLELQDKTEANRMALATLGYCTAQLGKPVNERAGIFTWKTSDGNVILQTGAAADGFAVNLFVTTKNVSTFPLLGKGDPTKDLKSHTAFGKDGRATIALEKNARMSDVLHSLAMVFRKDLEGADLLAVEHWLGVQDGVWTERNEHQFASGFERFIWDGKDFPARLAGASKTLRETIPKIEGTRLDVEVPSDVTTVFRHLMGMR